MITGCFSTCSSCISPNNILACLSCNSLPLYITSCQGLVIDTTSIVYIIALTVMILILLLHLMMLLTGNGIYREAY